MEKYDASHRLIYNPDYHAKQGTEWTLEDVEYLCKFIEVDGPKKIALALERTEATVANKVYSLRKRGLFEVYKKMNRYW